MKMKKIERKKKGERKERNKKKKKKKEKRKKEKKDVLKENTEIQHTDNCRILSLNLVAFDLYKNGRLSFLAKERQT